PSGGAIDTRLGPAAPTRFLRGSRSVEPPAGATILVHGTEGWAPDTSRAIGATPRRVPCPMRHRALHGETGIDPGPAPTIPAAESAYGGRAFSEPPAVHPRGAICPAVWGVRWRSRAGSARGM